MVLYTKDSVKPKKIYINENQVHLLSEDVFASGIRRKKGQTRNKIQLSYNKRASQDRVRNVGSINPFELLNTGKMDQDNADTYEVPLKGGIMSYNITSIRGTEIMHYFKNNRKANMAIDLDNDGAKEDYELIMDDPEFYEFLKIFCRKVGNVLKFVTNKIYNESDNKVTFNGISILPVPSSSDFNRFMANTLAAKNISFGGLPIKIINHEMFKKDMTNLAKDEDFISKNKDYYQDRMFTKGDDDISHEGYIDNTLTRFKHIENAKKLIPQYNSILDKLVRCYHNCKANKSMSEDDCGRLMAKWYIKLHKAYNELIASLNGIHSKKVFTIKKGAKGQIKDKRTEEFWRLVKPHLYGSGVYQMDITPLQPEDFQIKSLSNDVRMGMKNYFSSNEDIVQEEMEKIKGTIFVIFDDNISGGATLSDICMQAKNLGIEYIVPITFGQMSTKYNLGRGNMVNKPSKNGEFQNY